MPPVDRPAPPNLAIETPHSVACGYAATRDPELCETLVRLCGPMVRGIASDYRNPDHEEDLVQVGFVGLLNAAEHFDPSRGTPFSVFARHLIRGEIRHYLRDHQNLLRRPRWMDRVNGRIEQAVGEHLDESGRYPGLNDLAERLSLDLASLTEILKTRQVVRTLSLDAEDENGQPRIDISHAHRPSDTWLAAALEDRMMLIDALEDLNPLQRGVVFYIFFTDLTQGETARRLGVSQKHVSRVLASGLHQLREMLMPDPPAD